ncbi:uncharacterized protein LOC105217749 [Zeugodacus cucurbitae]|uniref:uncharacterized protein LOC105217749 n=1 Tax=Zeugodacus cucurbitae TaxID=28588 RepID=UPI0023D965C3|nr:uncharacterized protein LOC105217749 [Zeugodacus cucurbitae]
MALSVSTRQAVSQMPSSAWARQSQQQPPQQRSSAAMHLRLQKQHSFSEANRTQHFNAGAAGHLLAARRPASGYLTRGLSVDRSLESLRQKSAAAHEVQSKRVIARKSAKSGSERLKGVKNSTIAEGKYGFARAGSTSSLLKSLDHELKQVNGQLGQRFHCNSACVEGNIEDPTVPESLGSESNLQQPSSEHQCTVENSTSTLKRHNSKVNLNIVLSHAINYKSTNGNESNNSDIESSTEVVEQKRKTTIQTRALRTDLPTRTIAPAASTAANVTTTITANECVQQRRAQFRSSRNVTLNTSTNLAASVSPAAANNITAANKQQEDAVAVAPLTANNSGGGAAFNAAPALIVQRHPPLVRAMSAPVRSRSLDENNKGVFAFQKRKLRRRKPITRNASICEKVDDDILFDLNAINGKKPPISRTRSTLAIDVVTLVSLVSSEGSDSEKEDTPPETGHRNAERSRSTGAPSLRKAGKSVSFQENYPPNFQLATKEYSHMIRRGSIAPLAARLRANRPPTAPPVSIFMNETNGNNSMTTNTADNLESSDGGDSNANNVSNSTQNTTKDATELACNEKQNEEYIYPEYVRTLKERECWKLFRKMSVKGVSVTYETVLRGMLTPTEFRQIQKQREIEEAKARALEEEKDAALEQQTPTSAVDRLTQKLLKN